ncbi:MAG: hypothetical protein U5K29_11625 [Acidimicrobiales bacterium]|nr:hypothetical protein [Acidimicrobiales bacterium]
MPRWHVHIVQMRARDIKVGDVVAKDASRHDGWFRVHEVKALADGTVNLIDKANTRSFTAGPFDLVGLQTPVPLPAEAERNVRREEASRDSASGATTPQGAAREAAARQSSAGGDSGGSARALPGS